MTLFERWRKDREEDLDHEVADHFRRAIADRVARGETPEAARATVRREFGNVGRVRELTRESWGLAGATELARELRLALRSLRRDPGLVAIASLCLGLAIAVNTTIFAGLDPLVFKNLPASDRLVRIASHTPGRPGNTGATSLPDYLDWQAQAKTLERFGAYQPTAMNWAGDPPERLQAVRVSGGFLGLLGLRTMIGRELGPDDEIGPEPVVMVSERLWRRRFDSDPGIIGTRMQLDGASHTIVGVVPTRPRVWLFEADVWAVLGITGEADRGIRTRAVIGRLGPGASPPAARAELGDIMRRLGQQYPATNAGVDVLVESLDDYLVGPQTKQVAATLFIAIGFVLLIACANVANLLLARGTARGREIAVRTALGASRGRLVRQLLVESGILAGLGTAVGLALSLAGVAWIRWLFSGPGGVDGVEDIGLSRRTLVFTAAVAAVAALVFGLTPAFRATASNLGGPLRDSRGTTAGVRHGRLRNALVIGELALALALLVSAALLIQASVRIQRVDLGFNPAGAYSFSTMLDGTRYRDSAARVTFHEQLEQRLRHLPGIEAVGVGSGLPLHGQYGGVVTIVGTGGSDSGVAAPAPFFYQVSPGYLEATGMRLLRGRDIALSDRVDAPRVMLINDAFSRRHWPSGDPIGRRVRFRQLDYAIVGVVADLRAGGVDQPAHDLAFFASGQSPPSWASYVIRSGLDPVALTGMVRAAVQEIAPGQPVAVIQPLSDHARTAWRDYEIMTHLLTVVGAVAFLLALLGVYGVVSYAVAQRTRELGVRRALGARSMDVVRLVLRQTMTLVGAGSLIGGALALGSGRALAALFVSISPFDMLVFSGIPLVLVLAAIAATLGPARRATKVDAMLTLRGE